MRVMVTRRHVLCGESLPRGYRVAWWDFASQRAVCYPIGIHVVAWALWRLWQYTYYPLREPESALLREQNRWLCEKNARLHEEVDALTNCLRITLQQFPCSDASTRPNSGSTNSKLEASCESEPDDAEVN